MNRPYAAASGGLSAGAESLRKRTFQTIDKLVIIRSYHEFKELPGTSASLAKPAGFGLILRDGQCFGKVATFHQCLYVTNWLAICYGTA